VDRLVSPSRLTFWRLVLATICPLAWLSLAEAFALAEKLGVAPLTSKTWLVILGVLALAGGLSLFLFGLTFTRRFVSVSIEKLPRLPRWLALMVFTGLLAAFPLFYFLPYYGTLLGKQVFLRLFIFCLLSLAGMLTLKLAFPRLEFPAALAFALTCQAAANLVINYLPDISAYPFAMGWAETSRLYYPSLFVSRWVYGQSFPWPILHPSLHFLLAPPYLFNASLWFHRFWQVALRFLLVGLIVPALLSRLKISSRPLRLFAAAWIFLYLFDLPLYLHVAVIVFTLLWSYSAAHPRRTWFWLILASIWAGLSRLNWYPMPGILAAVLYLLETPFGSKAKAAGRSAGPGLLFPVLAYLTQPALWIIFGTATAFLAQRVYIAFSGVPAAAFYTSLSSDLLWYRLWPNASYDLGVIPGTLLFVLPLLVLTFLLARRDLHPLRQVFLWLGLAGLFAAGLLVSLKIGGGADLHNMDIFLVTLLVVFGYLFTGSHTADTASESVSPSVSPFLYPFAHPFLLVLLVLIPVWFGQRASAGIWSYDPAQAQATLTALQRRVDATSGEILFISQRHLVSMHMLTGVTLVPQYEREDLMELAMSRNTAALEAGLYADLQARRFALIVVDPLRFNYLGSNYAMGEENNAWTRYIIKPILCNYKQAAIFPADRLALYVPQVGTAECP
jgi:hypothetical protein